MTAASNGSLRTFGNTFNPSSKFSRFFAALFLMLSTRYIGTPWVIKNISPFSKKDPSYAPSRPEFLVKSVSAMVVSYLVIDAIDLLPPPDPEVQFPQYKQALFSIVSEIDLEEVVTRAVGVLIGGIATYCYTSFQYYFLVTVQVGLGFGLSEPATWPPVFGRFLETWSIRRFWGYVSALDHLPFAFRS
jgi:hypothetical protein